MMDSRDRGLLSRVHLKIISFLLLLSLSLSLSFSLSLSLSLIKKSHRGRLVPVQKR